MTSIIKVRGTIVDPKFKAPEPGKKGHIQYIAPAPAEHRDSYHGSGLPFANYAMAVSNTPNEGVAEIDSSGSFEFEIMSPNSFYNLYEVVHPHVLVKYECINDTIGTTMLAIPNSYIENRAITTDRFRPIHGGRIMSAEQTLRHRVTNAPPLPAPKPRPVV